MVPEKVSRGVETKPLCLELDSEVREVGRSHQESNCGCSGTSTNDPGTGCGGERWGRRQQPRRQTASLLVTCQFGCFPANRGSRRLLGSSWSTPGLTGAIWKRRGSLRHLRAPPPPPPRNIPRNICKLTPRLGAKWPPEEPFEKGFKKKNTRKDEVIRRYVDHILSAKLDSLVESGIVAATMSAASVTTQTLHPLKKKNLEPTS